MPVPTYALPSIGELNAIADPKVRDALSQLLAYLTGGLTAENLSPDLLTRTAFVGEVRMSGRDAPPTAWLICDGRAVSRTTYSALFQALGIKYGPGDGNTTFNLPDFQERFPAGSKAGGLQAGQIGGEKAHKLLANEIPAHTHQQIAGNGPGGNTLPQVGTNLAPYGTAVQTSANTGGDGTHENRPPFTTMNFVIYAGV